MKGGGGADVNPARVYIEINKYYTFRKKIHLFSLMKYLSNKYKSQLNEPLFASGCTIVQLEKSPIADKFEFVSSITNSTFFAINDN